MDRLRTAGREVKRCQSERERFWGLVKFLLTPFLVRGGELFPKNFSLQVTLWLICFHFQYSSDLPLSINGNKLSRTLKMLRYKWGTLGLGGAECVRLLGK